MSEAQKEPTSKTPQSVIQGEQGLDAAQIGISVFIIAALTFLAYFNTFNIPLHGPDQLLFAESKALHHITSTPQALPQQPYAPLALLSWACNWRIAPFHIDLMHGGNLLFQILNSILLYFLCRELLRHKVPEAVNMLSGLLFAVSPLVLSTVNMLSLRPVLQGAFFALLSLLFYVRSSKDASTTSWRSYAFSLLCYVLSVGSFFFYLPLPLLLLLLEGVNVKKMRNKASLLRIAPLLMLMLSLFVSLHAAGYSLSMLYKEWPVALSNYVLSATIALGIVAVYTCLEKAPLRVLAGLLLAVLILTAAGWAFYNTGSQRDPVVYWEKQCQDAPDEECNWLYWGRALMNQADQQPTQEERLQALKEILPHLKKAHQNAASNATLATLLGGALYRTGVLDAAEPILKEALRNAPFEQDAAIFLALLYEKKARLDKSHETLHIALDYFRRAEALASLPQEAQLPYGMTMGALGRHDEAVAQLASVRETMPALAPVYERFQQLAQQEEEVQKRIVALSRQPQKALEGLLAQAELRVLRGDLLHARYWLHMALAKEPTYTPAWEMLGWLNAKTGEEALFIKAWGTTPGYTENHWLRLAKRCATASLWEPALTYLRHAASQATPTFLPEIALAQIALELKQPQQAQYCLQQAVERYPDAPAPWLMLADLAIANKEIQRAAQCLAEAEKRGASPEAIEKRRSRADISADAPLQPTRTLIR